MWDKLSIKDKAKIIKMGVANGIRDLDTIRDTYNNVYAEGGDTNLLNNQDFLNQYGIHWEEDPLMNDYYAQHPSELNKPTTAGMPAAYNNRVLVNRYGVPQSQQSLNRYAKDYALIQPQVSRKEEREVEKKQADEYVSRVAGITKLNKTEMNNLANLGLIIGGTAAAAPSFLYAPLATTGLFIGANLGSNLTNRIIRNKSNNKYDSWGDYLEKKTNGYIRADNGEFLNPGGLLGSYYGMYGTVLPFRFKASMPSKLNYAQKVITDMANFPGEIGIFQALQEGRYIRNMGDMLRHARALDKESSIVREDLWNLYNRDGKNFKNIVPTDDFEPFTLNSDSFNNTKLNIVKEPKPNTLASYSYQNRSVNMPIAIKHNSNIARDYSNYYGRWLLGHEYDHALQDTERFNVARWSDKSKYYVPNEEHPLYSKMKILKEGEYPWYSIIKPKRAWVQSPEEVMSEAMGYRIANENLPTYNLMDIKNKTRLNKFISKRFKISRKSADNLLTEFSNYGY